jgi:hypothetical protein
MNLGLELRLSGVWFWVYRVYSLGFRGSGKAIISLYNLAQLCSMYLAFYSQPSGEF